MEDWQCDMYAEKLSRADAVIDFIAKFREYGIIVPGHRLGMPGVLYRWSSAVWDYASREASSPSALRVCSISGRIPNLARMMIVDWEPPSSRMRRTRFS